MTGNDSMACMITALIDDEELQMPAATENYSVSTKFEDYTVSVRLALSGTIICLSGRKLQYTPITIEFLQYAVIQLQNVTKCPLRLGITVILLRLWIVVCQIFVTYPVQLFIVAFIISKTFMNASYRRAENYSVASGKFDLRMEEAVMRGDFFPNNSLVSVKAFCKTCKLIGIALGLNQWS